MFAFLKERRVCWIVEALKFVSGGKVYKIVILEFDCRSIH